MAELTKGLLMGRIDLGKDYFSLIIEAPPIVEDLVPGQFVQIRCGDGLDPLLRRPLSIHRYHRGLGLIELLIREKGKGTTWLRKQRAGVYLDILGPLGRGFTLTEGDFLLVGGGIGVAPLLPLGEDLYSRGQKGITLLGGNSAGDLLKLPSFQEISQRVQVSTVDGSAGRQGFVTELLERELKAGFQGYIYTCGPLPMLGAVAQLATAYGIKGEASLEAPMACGIGVCLGCVSPIKNGTETTFAHVCKDGPVFPLEVVDYHDEN